MPSSPLRVMRDRDEPAASPGVPQQLAKGSRPVDPEKSSDGMQELIKFRIATDDKQVISDAADRAGVTVSELLRRAGRAAASGRIASRAVLMDLVSIRSAANRLATLADTPNVNPARTATEGRR